MLLYRCCFPLHYYAFFAHDSPCTHMTLHHVEDHDDFVASRPIPLPSKNESSLKNESLRTILLPDRMIESSRP